MSWLVEAFLDEAMKNANDFVKKKEKEEHKKELEGYKNERRREALGNSFQDNEESHPELKNEKNMKSMEKSLNKAMAHKYGKNWKKTKSDEIDADVTNAASATLRHMRKNLKESSWLVGSFIEEDSI